MRHEHKEAGSADRKEREAENLKLLLKLVGSREGGGGGEDRMEAKGADKVRV